MTIIFVDTSHFIARANPSDSYALAARRASNVLRSAQLVTTDGVLSELLAYFAARGPTVRRTISEYVRDITRTHTVVWTNQDSFVDALDLYERRLDKGYSLVDCSSMLVARSLGITDVLTTDRHFEQEGFVALLRS